MRSLAFMETCVTRLDMHVSKRCALQASGSPLNHRERCMRLLLDLLGNKPLSDSAEGIFLWLLSVKVISEFASFTQAEITRFGYENLSADCSLCGFHTTY